MFWACATCLSLLVLACTTLKTTSPFPGPRVHAHLERALADAGHGLQRRRRLAHAAAHHEEGEHRRGAGGAHAGQAVKKTSFSANLAKKISSYVEMILYVTPANLVEVYFRDYFPKKEIICQMTNCNPWKWEKFYRSWHSNPPHILLLSSLLLILVRTYKNSSS